MSNNLLLTTSNNCRIVLGMLETAMAKIPDSIPKEEGYAILGGAGKKNRTFRLTDKAMQLLDEERVLFEVTHRAQALEILLRERQEARKKKRR